MTRTLLADLLYLSGLYACAIAILFGVLLLLCCMGETIVRRGGEAVKPLIVGGVISTGAGIVLIFASVMVLVIGGGS